MSPIIYLVLYLILFDLITTEVINTKRVITYNILIVYIYIYNWFTNLIAVIHIDILFPCFDKKKMVNVIFLSLKIHE